MIGRLGSEIQGESVAIAGLVCLSAAPPHSAENFVRRSTMSQFKAENAARLGVRRDEAVKRLLSRAISALLMLFDR